MQEIKKENARQCWLCKNERTIPGDCHIQCTKPLKEMRIGSGGNERYEQAQKMAKENNAVVRCVWPGSGFYPLCFDSNTVFGCNAFELDEKKFSRWQHKKQQEQDECSPTVERA